MEKLILDPSPQTSEFNLLTLDKLHLKMNSQLPLAMAYITSPAPKVKSTFITEPALFKQDLERSLLPKKPLTHLKSGQAGELQVNI